MKWYLKVLRQYLDFNGRARRKEYWMYSLFYSLFSILMPVLAFILSTEYDSETTMVIKGLLVMLLFLVHFIAGIAVAVRRLHDTGKSGWMILYGLFPVIGQIWLIVIMATDSSPGENQYGPNPKEVSL